MRQALAGSLNIPAVKTLYLAGVENVKQIMENLGYSTINEKSQCGLSLVLGGCEIKLIDHVGAFTAFARDGERAELAAILKVEDKTGKVLYEFQEKKHKKNTEGSWGREDRPGGGHERTENLSLSRSCRHLP